MKIRKPDYYDQFQCIAGACSDSCCIGWEIDIDEEQKVYYQMLSRGSGDLGKRLSSCIDWEEGHFILQGKEERCPFLNRDHLCDLILTLGEDSLCDICREHPRFYDWFDGLTEVGLGLCCEAAGRRILGKEEPVTFVEEVDGAEDLDEELQILFQAREKAMQILQDRTISIWKRLDIFLCFIEQIQEILDFGDIEELRELAVDFENTEEPQDRFERVDYGAMIQLCRSLESIDDSWTEQLDQLEAFMREPQDLDLWKTAAQIRPYEYEHLAVYFVYRYFMKCRKDGDFYSKGCLTVFCLLLMLLFDVKTLEETKELTMEDRVQHAKCISKEIEYSEENLELLADAFWSGTEESK